MRRNGTVELLACALTAAAMISASPARAESFDARWSAMDPAPKGDRLEVREQTAASKVIFLHDPQGRMTVAQKTSELRVSDRKSPVRTVPTVPIRKNPEENIGKTRPEAMDGCEPSFSPVTMPSMANVASRCIASLDTPAKVASLLR